MTIASPAITVLRRLLDGLLLALVAVSLGVLVLGRIVPLVGHPTFVVAGPSMEPSIPIGSAVVLDQVPPSSLAVGDVVSLRSGAGRAIFTHRIVRLAERDGGLWLETKGDANADPDPSIIPATAVIGRLAVTLPYAGYLVRLLGTAQGVLFVLAFGVFALAGTWLLESLEIDQVIARRRRAQAGLAPLAADPPVGQGA